MQSSPKVPWSVWDRFLFVTLGLVFVLVVGLGFWLHALDANPTVTVPTPTMPVKNAYTYYVAAAKAVVDNDKIDSAIQNRKKVTDPKWPGDSPSSKPLLDRPYSLAEKVKLVTENAAAIQLLHTGFQYPHQAPPIRSFKFTYPEYQKERALARFLALQAQVKAQQGDWNGAVNADLDAIQMGETMPHGGSLIAMLVGIACESIGRRRAWGAVPHLNAVQAFAAEQRLEHIRTAHVPTADVIQEDKWARQASLMQLMRANWPSSFVSMMNSEEPDNGSSTPQFAQWLFGTRIRFTGKRTIMANYSTYMDKSIANARQPYAAHLPDPPMPTDPVNTVLLPEFENLRLAEVNADTQNALFLTTLALQAYHQNHHAYPASLSQLVPQYLPAVPTDPFALSGSVRYKPLGSRYLLYSVGPDGKDDGGQAIFDHSLPAPTTSEAFDRRHEIQNNSRGDIVAGVNIN